MCRRRHGRSDIAELGKTAAGLTGAGIGVGVARKLDAGQLVIVSAAVVGMIGAFASGDSVGTGFLSGRQSGSWRGRESRWALLLAAYHGDRDRDPDLGEDKTGYYSDSAGLHRAGIGCRVCLAVPPPISEIYVVAGLLRSTGEQSSSRCLMGVVVSVLMGMILTLPISSAALGVILNLSGLAAGAATSRAAARNMIGFAVASWRENKFGGFLAQGIGTSMLQVPNIVRQPSDLGSGDFVQRRSRLPGGDDASFT